MRERKLSTNVRLAPRSIIQQPIRLSVKPYQLASGLYFCRNLISQRTDSIFGISETVADRVLDAKWPALGCGRLPFGPQLAGLPQFLPTSKRLTPLNSHEMPSPTSVSLTDTILLTCVSWIDTYGHDQEFQELSGGGCI